MAQHDFVIDNASGVAVRTDLNAVLQAIVTNNSGATEPATKYPNMWWYDTSTGLLKRRNNANDAWVTVGLEAADTDGTLAENSDAKVATQKATKTYADTKIPTSYLDTDTALTANSDVKIASQKAGKAYTDGKFNTSTGHDHDGTDSKKVVYTNLDMTGITNGHLLYNNNGTPAGMAIPASDVGTVVWTSTIGATYSVPSQDGGWRDITAASFLVAKFAGFTKMKVVGSWTMSNAGCLLGLKIGSTTYQLSNTAGAFDIADIDISAQTEDTVLTCVFQGKHATQNGYTITLTNAIVLFY